MQTVYIGIVFTFILQLKYHHSQNLVWKCSLQNVGHFCGRCVYVYTTLRMLPGNFCHTYLMKYSWTNKNTDFYCDWSDNCTITWTCNGSLLSIIMIFLSTKPPYMTSLIEWIIETCWHITPITHYGWGKWYGWTAKYARLLYDLIWKTVILYIESLIGSTYFFYHGAINRHVLRAE